MSSAPPEASPSPAVPAGTAAPPATAAGRLDSLDLLRGVAVLGIFLMNSWTMGLPQDAYTNLNAYTTDWIPGEGFPAGHLFVGGTEYAVYVGIHLLADMKFISIFSLLFGAGILLQSQRVAARGGAPERVHCARMGVLLVFGLIHAYGLWYGDILVTYALAGMLLFPFRRLPPNALWPLGLALLAVVPLISVAHQAHWTLSPTEALLDVNRALSHGGNDRELAAYRGGWWRQMDHRAWEALHMQATGIVLWTFWRCGGLMLIGMALLKGRFFQGAWPRPAYAALAWLLIPAGWMITYLGVRFNDAVGWVEDWSSPLSVWGLGVEFNYWGSLLTALGYAALGVLVAQWAAEPARAWARQGLAPLRAVGRTALSNYILQSVLGTTLFYGHGFGLFGWLTRAQILVLVLIVWAVQLLASTLWLRFFRQGPLEWLWHRLVYGRGNVLPSA